MYYKLILSLVNVQYTPPSYAEAYMSQT